MTTPEQADLRTLFEAQGAYFASGRARPIEVRREFLRAFDRELGLREDEALEALGADLGKPPLEAWLAEVNFLRTEIKHALNNVARWGKPLRVRNPFFFFPARSEVRREPFGRVVVAAPWNYPLQLALSPLLSAVTAGNCVILKPSELAPATSRFLAELVSAVFDPGHVTVVEGGADVGRGLLELPFDFFFYTGGEKVGRLYAEAAARHLAPVALELGGKCPCVLTEDADLDCAVERIIANKFFNAGQTCVAPDFVMLPQSMHDAFIEKARSQIETSYGDTISPDLARIVNDSHFARLAKLTPANAIAIGTDDPSQRYMAPRVIPNAKWEDAAMAEEIFGPVLPVIPYPDEESTVQTLRALPAPLALYVFGKKVSRLEEVANSIASGAVCFNDVMKPAANHHLPLGGVGESGMGRYRSAAGYRNFTYERSVTRRWQGKDYFAVKPPYGDRLALLRRFLGR